MSDPVIVCPQCSAPIPLTEAIAAPIRRAYEDQLRQTREELSKREAKVTDRESLLKRQQEDREAEWNRRQAEEEARLRKLKADQDAELARQRAGIDETVNLRLQEAKEVLVREETDRARAAVGIEMREMKECLAERDARLAEAQQRELAFLKLKRDIEDRERQLQLQTARRIDEERGKIREAAQREATEQFRLQQAEKDQQLAGMRRQIDELRQKAEQGSQQAQGEVMELELERLLAAKFPLDRIEPVPKGVRGADVLQYVRNGAGHECGVILWESKRTRQWNADWLAKLREDQRTVNADVAALVSQTLPRDLATFEQRDGIWVAAFNCTLGLGAALRHALIAADACRLAQQGRQSKMEILYEYLAGGEFRHRVEAIVEAFKGMRQDLEKEKRAMQRSWASREKQIDGILTHTVGLHGDVAGIIGADLQAIESLQFPALETDET